MWLEIEEGATVSDRTGYEPNSYLELCNCHWREISSHYSTAHMCSQRHLQLWLPMGFRQVQTGVSRFGKCNGLSSASMCKCSFTEIIVILSGSISCSWKKADKQGNMWILLASSLFLFLPSWSFIWNGFDLSNGGEAFCPYSGTFNSLEIAIMSTK